MLSRVDKIDDCARFEYRGNVHVQGSVGKNAIIVVTNGALTIDGSVGDNVQITLQIESNLTLLKNDAVPLFSAEVNKFDLLIHGDVGSAVIVKARNSNFKVDGNIASLCKFETHNGNIDVQDIGKRTSLRTHNGNIVMNNMAENSKAVTVNGDVFYQEAHQTAKQSSYTGVVVQKHQELAPREKNSGVVSRF